MFNQRFFLAFFVIVIMFCSNPEKSLAAPAIEQIYFDGSQLTITGQLFGVKSPAAPLVWDTFENGTLGNAINDSSAIVGDWDVGYKFDNVFYTNAVSYAASGKSARHPFSSGTWGSNLCKNDTFPTVYLDFKRYYSSGNGAPSNYKPWRIYGDTDMQFYHGYGCNYAVVTTHDDGLNDVTWPGGQPQTDTWEHFQVVFTESSVSTEDGTTILYLNCDTYVNDTSRETRTSSGHLSMIRIGHYFNVGAVGECDPSDNSVIYTDNVYIDTTWARVEIGDVQVYENCTHREIQIPSAWSDSSITVSVNQGSFQSGDTAYLFVVDADGNVNTNGYPITIGGGGSDNLPTVDINSPTSENTFDSVESTINLAGSGSDDNGISSITWTNSRGGSDTAYNNSGDWTSWSIPNISLQEDENIITVTATDSAGQTSSDSLTVTYNSGGSVQAWSANEQADDYSWDDSGATWCARVLIEGNSIIQSGNQIMLGFQGRDSGDYRTRKVSIAEVDPNGGEGDVIDFTWTRVTFDGNSDSSWGTDVSTVLAGTEKLSDPVYLSIEPGKDYYVTYLLESPSVYLFAPSDYRELYFDGIDHTEDIDWSANGHSTYAARLHAIASIYVVNNGTDTTAPGDVSGFTATPGPDRNQITLAWTNPPDTDFAGVMIRYRTDGTNPQNKYDGSPIPNGNDGKIAGLPGQSMSYVHTNLDPIKHYYYSAFSYDISNNYSQTAYADAQPLSSNNAPVIQSFTGVPSSLNNPGETTTFNVSATDPDGDSLTYTINFGDGTANGSGSEVVHTYATKGTYTAEVSVDDGNGHIVGKSLQVPVNDIRPAEPTNVSAN